MNIKGLKQVVKETEQGYSEKIFENTNCIYTFINPYCYHLLRKNDKLYLSFDGIFIDGILMCIMFKLLHLIRIQRRSFDMSSVAHDFFQRVNRTREGVFFVGAASDEIEKTIAFLKSEYQNIHIVGYRNGFFDTTKDKEACYQKIVDLNPSFVVVGMGTVLQEEFLIGLKESGYTGIGFSCGGFLRQSSTGLFTYPNWINKYHLRAFYRLKKEEGLYGRLFHVLIGFPIQFTYDSMLDKINIFK